MDPTIDPLLSALPPSWLAAIEAYAPTVLAWTLLVIALVHLLLPIARRVETWAIATPDPRDDGPARRAVEVLEWIAGVSRCVLSWIPRFTIGDPERPKTVRRRAETMRPPPPSSGPIALALIVVAAACSVLTSGCSGAAAAGPIAITARDVTCRGGRVVCRLVDRVCRGTGGPWVVPRSAEEVASDAASRLTGAEGTAAEDPAE